jgi:hypothetical protein
VRVMVIERYRDGAAEAVYRRFDERGRMIPVGLTYIDSWVDITLGRCFQLMECDDAALLDEWAQNWSDLVDFEFVPVIGSAEARAAAIG